MQGNSNQKPHSKLIRSLSLIAAIIVLIGSVLMYVWPGLDMRSKNASFVPFVSSAYAEEFKELKKGSSGQAVKEMQFALAELDYYAGPVDGNFSKALESAVQAFQKDFDLAVTGRIDYDTYLLLAADVPDILPEATAAPKTNETPFVILGEWYSDKDHVAAYLLTFEELPENYLTKKEAQALGWISSKGNLWDVAPGMSIGGDRFGNYEGILPKKNGRQYYECDIDFDGTYRNGKRIVFSNDGLIFYTEDHYETFEEITE